MYTRYMQNHENVLHQTFVRIGGGGGGVYPVYAKPWKRLASDICSD